MDNARIMKAKTSRIRTTREARLMRGASEPEPIAGERLREAARRECGSR